jgi:hypothetical protein
VSLLEAEGSKLKANFLAQSVKLNAQGFLAFTFQPLQQDP